MKKLLKTYGLNSDMQYFELIATSFLNGQFAQAYEQFDAMPKKCKLSFLKSATVGVWDNGIGNHKLANLFDRL